jgi:hypothetical protein
MTSLGNPSFLIPKTVIDQPAVWPQNGQANSPKALTRPHFLHMTWPVCAVAVGAEGVRCRA